MAGVEGEDAEKHAGKMVYTSMDEARTYVELTRVDFLAVSIGTVHKRMKGEPVLDFERLKDINETLNIPLVIHGCTGLSAEQFSRLITNGVAKINYDTALADAAGETMPSNVAANETCGYTGIVQGIRDAMRAELERCLLNWVSAGQAHSVIEASDAWQPVHHVIIYNVNINDDVQLDHMMNEGEKVLSIIPGVRRVITGKAVQENAKYKFTWLIEFVHEKVIDSYPDHVAFADNLFRSVAGDRISIDFRKN